MAVGFCAANKIATFNDFVSSFNYANNEFTLGFSYPTYGGCVDYNNNSFPPSNSATNFCQQYLLKAGNYYCVNCKRGYTGKVMKNGDHSYVTCDTKIDGCTNDIYGGFYISRKS